MNAEAVWGHSDVSRVVTFSPKPQGAMSYNLQPQPQLLQLRGEEVRKFCRRFGTY